MTIDVVPLEPLRDHVSPHFHDWYEATRAGDAVRGRKARLAVGRASRNYLATSGFFDCPGLYLFLNDRATRAEDGIVYIGLVKRRAGKQRMLDYLCKQVTLLNRSLCELPLAMAETEIDHLLRWSLISTRAETRRKYSIEHSKSWRLSRATQILVHRLPDAEVNNIEAAETLLIRSLVEVTGAPDTLVNKSKKNGPWPPRHEALVGDDTATAAIKGWTRLGLDRGWATKWEETIRGGVAQARRSV